MSDCTHLAECENERERHVRRAHIVVVVVAEQDCQRLALCVRSIRGARLLLTRIVRADLGCNQIKSVKLRIDRREIRVRRVQRKQMDVTRAIALPKEQHQTRTTNERDKSSRTAYQREPRQ
jgi:hypothetical protein